ncbi:hypothetical protein Q427_23805 [Halomonas sp. BC04]|nr:hypothetical protein Q427_23805 [Halomonas sp. BC04]
MVSIIIECLLPRDVSIKQLIMLKGLQSKFKISSKSLSQIW